MSIVYLHSTFEGFFHNLLGKKMSIVYLLYIVASALKVDQYKSGSKVYFFGSKQATTQAF